uniref:SRCR domain-containing protein n=1 Tax=Trichuris muris TaxID=70415 RepID=A0A5S6QZ98_TRIMR
MDVNNARSCSTRRRRPRAFGCCDSESGGVWSDRWCGPTGGCRGHLAQSVWSDQSCGPTAGCRGQPARSMWSNRCVPQTSGVECEHMHAGWKCAPAGSSSRYHVRARCGSP